MFINYSKTFAFHHGHKQLASTTEIVLANLRQEAAVSCSPNMPKEIIEPLIKGAE